MKAHGVPALIRHIRGEIPLDEAATIGRADTRHYAKRQFTWFRHQLPEFEWVKPEAARGWLRHGPFGAAVAALEGGRPSSRSARFRPDAFCANAAICTVRKFALAQRGEPR